MGRKKEVVYKNERYAGKYLDDETCNKLEALLKLDRENGVVSDLKHCIFDLPPSTVELIKTSKSNAFAELEKGTLTDHQTIGVAYMYFAERLLLGDSVGLGKTVEVAALCNLIEHTMAEKGMSFRFLFLTEKTAIPQIRNKMIKFTGNYVEELYGEKRYIQKFIEENSEGVQYSIVGSHSLLTNVLFQQYFIDYMQENCCPFDILIIDESGDVLTNSANKTYESAKFYAQYFDRIILLNATAFEKDLRQFYNQLNYIDETFLPTKTAFSQEYEVMEYGVWGRRYGVFNGKYKNQDKFRDLVSYRYLARTRESTGAEMVDCTAEVFVSELSSVQKSLLRTASLPMMVFDCPSYFNRVGYSNETNIETTPKLRDLVNLITGRLSNERSILVYARYKESQTAIQQYMEEMGISVKIMNGETPQKIREDYTTSFKLGDIRVLVTNVQKGLDFGECNHCIFYDFDPNPNNMVQFEGRMTRDHSIYDKHVYLLLSKGQEVKKFKEVVADRAKASDLFAGSDFSCVLSILLQNDMIKDL